MKMSHKLIILFSVLAILTTAAFSIFSYSTSIKNLSENTATSLNTLGSKMQSEIEQQIEMMEYSLEELTSNIDFMDAFYEVYLNSGSDDFSSIAGAQTIMSRIMYQAPLQSAFYRVSAYTRDGFYLTNLFEKTDAVVSFSDEAKDTVNSLSYLDEIDLNPFRSLVVCPHNDPWSAIRPISVFTLVKAVIWHGDIIGYLEISSSTKDLENIFQSGTDKSLHTKAVFSDGSVLFSSDGNYASYSISESKTVESQLLKNAEDTSALFHSKVLDLYIFISQDVSIFQNMSAEIFKNSLIVIIPLLAVILILVVIISYGLTNSIRKLGSSIRQLPSDTLSKETGSSLSIDVVKPSDKEIYELEQSFNELLGRLKDSYNNEVILREGSLKAQLNALQLQINPHFVYNTLNIISAKGMESGNEEITELCGQFALMLRYSTDIRSQTASIENELDNVQRYLYLCKARFEDKLEFEIDVPLEMNSLTLPKLTLQPLVENALKYGVDKSTGIMSVSIKGFVSGNELTFTIKDKGSGFEDSVLSELLRNFKLIEEGGEPEVHEKEGHLGIINTYLRLYYYSRGSIKMHLYNDGGAVVELKEILENVSDYAG